MRLIDADKLLENIEKRIKGAKSLAEVVDLTMIECITDVQQSVPAVPLDRIKEAREEMVNGMPSIRTEGQLTGEDVVFSTACECYAECIMILDKLIAEVEGMNEAD